MPAFESDYIIGKCNLTITDKDNKEHVFNGSFDYNPYDIKREVIYKTYSSSPNISFEIEEVNCDALYQIFGLYIHSEFRHMWE